MLPNTQPRPEYHISCKNCQTQEALSAGVFLELILQRMWFTWELKTCKETPSLQTAENYTVLPAAHSPADLSFVSRAFTGPAPAPGTSLGQTEVKQAYLLQFESYTTAIK